jgi:hypothetical protein
MEKRIGKKFGIKGIGLYLVVFGASFLGVGGWLYSDQRNFEAKAVKAIGTVIEVKRATTTSTSSGSRHTTSYVYSPVVQFEAEGQRYTFTSRSASSDYNFPRGHRLEILYDPANPGDARLKDRFFSLLPLIFLGVGVLIVMIGLLVLFKFKKANDSTTEVT